MLESCVPRTHASTLSNAVGTHNDLLFEGVEAMDCHPRHCQLNPKKVSILRHDRVIDEKRMIGRFEEQDDGVGRNRRLFRYAKARLLSTAGNSQDGHSNNIRAGNWRVRSHLEPCALRIPVGRIFLPSYSSRFLYSFGAFKVRTIAPLKHSEVSLTVLSSDCSEQDQPLIVRASVQSSLRSSEDRNMKVGPTLPRTCHWCSMYR